MIFLWAAILVTVVVLRVHFLEYKGQAHVSSSSYHMNVSPSSQVTVIVLRVHFLEYKGDARGLYWFETFYRIGSYIYGGGQVVLPLIIEQVVRCVIV